MRYELYETKTGRLVGALDPDGTLAWSDPLHYRSLTRVVGRELLTRENDNPATADFGEIIEEGEMCYMGLRSVSPQDKDYLAILLRQLPLLTGYEARPLGA